MDYIHYVTRMEDFMHLTGVIISKFDSLLLSCFQLANDLIIYLFFRLLKTITIEITTIKTK